MRLLGQSGDASPLTIVTLIQLNSENLQENEKLFTHVTQEKAAVWETKWRRRDCLHLQTLLHPECGQGKAVYLIEKMGWKQGEVNMGKVELTLLFQLLKVTEMVSCPQKKRLNKKCVCNISLCCFCTWIF